MKKSNKRSPLKSGFITISSSLLAIAVGLLLGLVIMLISNPDQALDGFAMIIKGGFEDGMAGIGQVLYYATPILLTGLSVGFAFKTGLFNIGASGQFIIGAFAAVYIGVKWTWMPGNLHWLAALTGAFVFGALWGFLPGLLKAFFNVHEVISSIMMNYIGMSLVNMLVKRTVYDQLTNRSQAVAFSANIPKWGLNEYELKACGFNPNASKYAGINAKRNIVLSMVIAGALSGAGGGLLYLAGSGKFIEVVDALAPEGFNGIPVALLGLSNPIGILFAALFIASITVGGFNLQQYEFVPEVINIITASIIYFSAFALIFKSFIGKLLTGRRRPAVGPDQNDSEGPAADAPTSTPEPRIEPSEGGGAI